jgi:hypothetical protein
MPKRMMKARQRAGAHPQPPHEKSRRLPRCACLEINPRGASRRRALSGTGRGAIGAALELGQKLFDQLAKRPGSPLVTSATTGDRINRQRPECRSIGKTNRLSGRVPGAAGNTKASLLHSPIQPRRNAAGEHRVRNVLRG